MISREIKKEFSHIHIPKCGGSWVDGFFAYAYPHALIHSSHGSLSNLFPSNWLAWRTGCGPLKDGHPMWDVNWTKEKPLAYKYEFTDPPTHPNRFEESVTFSTCRNPFDWLVSYYQSSFGGVRDIHGIRSFEEFVEKFCDRDFKWYHHGLHQFVFYQMYDHTGTCGVDWILRMEKLNEAITTMLVSEGADPMYLDECWKTFGSTHVDRDCGNPTKTRKHKDHRFYYDDRLRELATERFEGELTLYRYDFDGPTDSSAVIDTPKHWGPLICDPEPRALCVMNR